MSISVKIALVDDHVQLRAGLAAMIIQMGHTVLFEADNGSDMMTRISAGAEPDLVLMDVNMPVMDGYASTAWLKQQHPAVKTLALSIYDDDQIILRMLASGACGYVLKDAETKELQTAIVTVMQGGIYLRNR